MKFRELITKSGKLVLAGKDAETNEQLVEQAGKNEYVLHTLMAGSPFCNIKTDAKEVSSGDLKEASVFCAKYSRDWKKNHKDVLVHAFLGKEISKEKGMALGCFGVKKAKKISVKKEDLEE